MFNKEHLKCIDATLERQAIEIELANEKIDNLTIIIDGLCKKLGMHIENDGGSVVLVGGW